MDVQRTAIKLFQVDLGKLWNRSW